MARAARRPGRQAQIARLLVAGLAVLLAACANVGNPPGGPPDVAPPKIVAVKPESGAVVPNFKDDAIIQFDEVIDEMAGGGGGGGTRAAGLERQVLLSPVQGTVKVSWHRTNISVKPKEGWKRRVYRLEILPGIIDIRRNRLDSAKTVLFSTGPEIGHARIGGIALAWVDQRVLPRALIEAVPLPDSVGYLTVADSGGQFNLESLSPGQYVIYATADENGDRRRGLREAYDSVQVTVDSSTNVALYAFPHDTIPPRPRAASSIDSVSVRVEFSQPLDPAGSLDTAHVHVLELPDSTLVPIAQIMTQRVFDSLATAARAKADSARPDSLRPPRAPPTPAAPPARPQPARREPLVDTALVRQLLARRPVPSDKIVLTLGRPLKPETRYLVRIEGATNLIGKKGEGQVGFVVPKPAPADTTRDARRTPP